MRTEKPVTFEDNTGDGSDHWFGPFENYGKDDELAHQMMVQWPNIGILLAEAEAALEAPAASPPLSVEFPAHPGSKFPVIHELQPMSLFPWAEYDQEERPPIIHVYESVGGRVARMVNNDPWANRACGWLYADER